MSQNITRTVAETAGFVPQVWAQRALDILRANIVLLKLVARDTDYEPQPQGKTLTIPYPGTFTAQKKAQGVAATVQAPTGGSSVNVTLSELAYVDFVVEDFARVQASAELLDRYIEPAAVALAEQMETDLFTLYAALTGGSVGASGTDITPAEIRAAAKLLDDAKVPMSNRSLVISSKDRVALLGNSELTSYFAFSRPEGVAQGSLGNLYGFETFMSQLVPVVAGTPNSTKNVALHKNAMILATRPLGEPEPAAGLQASSLVDNESGIAIRVLKSYDMSARGHRIGFDVLYGYSILRPTMGVIALS
jgi:P22 coat protein - gene protein 5